MSAECSRHVGEPEPCGHCALDVTDGFGSTWVKCGRAVGCDLEVVRPGKVQCWRCDERDTPGPQL